MKTNDCKWFPWVLALGLALTAAGCDEWFGGGGGGGGDDDLGGVGDTCSEDEDCRDLLVCDADDTCQPGGNVSQDGYCELSGDCAEGLYCSFGRTCQPQGESGDGGPCGTTADCEAGLICVLEGLGGRCRTPGSGDLGDPCVSAADCLAGLTCLAGRTGETACDTPPRSSEPEPPPALPFWLGEECVEDESSAPTAYFQVPRDESLDSDFYRLPFPNDIRRTASGLDLSGHPHPETAVSDNIIDRYLRAAEEDLDGFARSPVVYFRFSVEQDYDTIHEAISLVNITPDSEDYGETEGYNWYATHYSGSRYICDNWIAIRPPPGFPLNSGETYAVILDTTLVPEEADAYQRAPDFEAMLADSPPSNPDLLAAHEAYAPLRDYLDESGTDPDTVLVAAVFTTQRSETVVSRLREVIRADDAPSISDLTLCDDGVTSPCDDGTPARACGAADDAFYELHGRIELPVFQQGTPPYETPADGGEIELDGSGRPRVARTEEVCFALTIPRDVDMPEGGFPLLIYGHGTGGSFRNAVLFDIAEDMATSQAGGEPLPVATMSIDFPQHGERRGESDGDPEVLFFNFMNPRAARDNVIQGAADLLSLVYWAEGYERAAAASPTGELITFDPTRIALLGHSQGATHAGLMVPFEPNLIAVVLSGEGGHLTSSLLNKTEPYDIASIVPYALLDPNEQGELAGGAAHPALALFQMYFERSDPVNYGGFLLPGTQGEDTPQRHLFMTYGLGDSYAPEATQTAYARSAELVLVEPVLTTDDDGDLDTLGLRTAPPPMFGNVRDGEEIYTYGVRQYEPDGDYDGHYVSTRHAQGRADVLRFLRQALAGETPRIGEE